MFTVDGNYSGIEEPLMSLRLHYEDRKNAQGSTDEKSSSN
jgi:hypothetical protein